MDVSEPQPDLSAPDTSGGGASPNGAFVAGRPVPTFDQLSRREREVALLIARGLSNRRIAETLHIGQRTAESHVARLMKKLGCANRAQVMLWALASFPNGDADGGES
jgi:DNA-binding NarL/FixJ family response regulator